MPGGPLEGIKVIDLSQNVSGPFCAKLMADFGADVIKVEPPLTGDPSRAYGPFVGDDPHPEKSALFLHLNTNKRGITLDIATKAGAAILRRLVADADVVVENSPPGRMAELGLDYEALEQINPRVVLTSITNFGQSGPYRDLNASEIVLYAMGGPMNVTGTLSKEPLKLGGNVVHYHAGSVAALATLVALATSEEDGEGQHLDVSVYETQAGFRDRRVIYLTSYAYTGDARTRPEVGSRLGGVRPCADGYVNLNATGRWFPALCRAIGHPELAQDPRFSTPLALRRPEAAEEFDEYFLPWMFSHDKREVVARLQDEKILSAPIFTVEDLINDPHYQQRGAFEEVDHPVAGKALYPSRPFIMSESPRPPARRAPLLGEHNVQIFCDQLGYSKEDLVRLREQGVV